MRRGRGLSQDQLAAKLGIASASIGFWETGSAVPHRLTAEWVRLVLSLSAGAEEAVEKYAKEAKKTLAEALAELITSALQQLGALPIRPGSSIPSPAALEEEAKKHKKFVEAQRNVPARRRFDKSA